MALIVEDGTQVVGAESYVSVANADTYFSKRGNATWAALTTAQKEEALRRATDYMVQVYRARWSGSRVSDSQALDWPRSSVALEDSAYGNLVATNVVPTPVQNACAELAVKASASVLAPDLEQGVTSEGVGPLSVSYDTTSPQYTRYRAIDLMLRMYLSGSGTMRKLERS